MELNTLEDIDTYFPDEETARKYFFKIRWGKFASCPYCGNDRCYFVYKGKAFKCANKMCYKVFSVTVKTLMEDSNIPLTKWLKIFYLYGTSRGRINLFDLLENSGLGTKGDKTGIRIKSKLDFLWDYIDAYGKSKEQIIEDMIKTCVHAYERYNATIHDEYSGNPFHLSGIDDISDARQYNKLLTYAQYFKNGYCHWIFIKAFAAPQDILAETFLWMRDNNVFEYNTESILRYIRNTTDRMWSYFLNTHPKFNEHLPTKKKQHSKDAIFYLKKNYIIKLILRRKSNHLTREQIKSDRDLIEKVRQEIRDKRIFKK